MNPPFLNRAKLFLPYPASDIVLRPRLIARLNWALERRLTLVSAPSAFGKTTLISSWLRELNLSSAWLTLDKEDNNLFLFLCYWRAALAQMAPGSGGETGRILDASTLPPLPVLVTALANDLADLPNESVLVLDDFHEVTDPSVHELLDRLIPLTPRNFHLVISSRVDPMLSLVTLRARAQLAELRQRDLRFTQDELLVFLSNVGFPDVDKETVEELERRTEGWMGGLRLYSYSARTGDDLHDLIHEPLVPLMDITTYFTNEILAHQPDPVRQFLRRTAITERFNLDLCKSLFQDSLAPDVLIDTYNLVHRTNLFITSLGRGWYTYHALFREVLLNELLREESVDTINALHRSAARWYESEGQIGGAVRHYLLAADEDLAVGLIARYRHEPLNRGAWTQLAARLDDFPETVVLKHPELGITAAWVAYNDSEPERALAYLETVEEQLEQGEYGFSPSERRALEGEANTMRGQLLLMNGHAADVPEHSRRALALLPSGYAMARSIAYVNLAVSLNHLGRTSEVRVVLEQALSEAADNTGIFESYVLLAGFVLAFMANNMLEAQRLAQRMLYVSDARDLHANAMWARYYLGRVAYALNDLELARQHFEHVVARRHETQVRSAMGSYIGLVQVLLALGQDDEALQLLQEAEEYAALYEEWVSRRWIATMSAYLALRQGRMQNALAWAQAQPQILPLTPTMLTHFEAPLIVLRILASDDSSTSQAAVSAILATYLPIAARANAPHISAELLALQARHLLVIDEPDAALDRIRESIELAGRGGLLRIIPDLGPVIVRDLLPLLRQLNQSGVAPDFLPSLLDKIAPDHTVQADAATPDNAAHTNGDLVEALRPREAEVLALLAEGLSNREIASRLYLSPKTIENYTLSLYAKLEVNRRGLAVAKARAIGLLP